MTPTTMPRGWEKVDDALDGVIAFPAVDRSIEAATGSLPAAAEAARGLGGEVPPRRMEAERRLASVRELRAVAADVVRVAADSRAAVRGERRRLRRRVLALRMRVIGSRVFRPFAAVAWWLLLALPRSARWVGRRVASPFHTRAETPFDDADDLPPRRRGR